MVTMKKLYTASRDAFILAGLLVAVLVDHQPQVANIGAFLSSELREQRRLANRNPPAPFAAASIRRWERTAARTLPSRRYELWRAIDGPDDPGGLHVNLKSVFRIQNESETDAFLDRARCTTTLDKDELRREIAILRDIAHDTPKEIKFVRHDFFPDGGIIPEWFIHKGSRHPVEDFYPRRVPLIEEVLEARLKQVNPPPERFLTVMIAANILFGFDSISGFRSAEHLPVSKLMSLEVGGSDGPPPSISRPYIFLDPSGEYMGFTTSAGRKHSEVRTASQLNLEITLDKAGNLSVFSWLYHGREMLRYKREYPGKPLTASCGGKK